LDNRSHDFYTFYEVDEVEFVLILPDSSLEQLVLFLSITAAERPTEGKAYAAGMLSEELPRFNEKWFPPRQMKVQFCNWC